MHHFLFFDIETTGLIKANKYNIDFKKKDDFPEIVQISWSVYKSNFEHIHTKNYIIKPDNYIIPEESSNIHKITTEIATSEGLDKTLVLNEFIKDLEDYKNIHIVSHNIEFDATILFFHIYCNFKEFYNNYIQHKIPFICTMLDTINLCALPSTFKSTSGYNRRKSFKFPKLSELHYKLFGIIPEGVLHDSSYDVQVLIKCFKELLNLKHPIKVRYLNFVS